MKVADSGVNSRSLGSLAICLFFLTGLISIWLFIGVKARPRVSNAASLDEKMLLYTEEYRKQP